MKIKTNIRAGSGGSSTSTSTDTSAQGQKQTGQGGVNSSKINNAVFSSAPVGRCVGI